MIVPQSKPVRICMITTIAKSFEWFVSDSAKNLAQKGFDVTIMCNEMDEAFLSKHEKFARSPACKKGSRPCVPYEECKTYAQGFPKREI